MTRTGRPPKLDQVLRVQPDGTKVTIADEIIDRVRSGAATLDASASVGIHRTTLLSWLKEGARHASRRVNGERLTAREKRLADFSDREAHALAEWKVEQEVQLGILTSHRQRQIVTEKRDADDALMERTTRVEGIEPDARVIQWRLERRFPEQYGRQRLELSGPDGGPIPVSVRDEAKERLEAMAERLAENTGQGG